MIILETWWKNKKLICGVAACSSLQQFAGSSCSQKGYCLALHSFPITDTYQQACAYSFTHVQACMILAQMWRQMCCISDRHLYSLPTTSHTHTQFLQGFLVKTAKAATTDLYMENSVSWTRVMSETQHLHTHSHTHTHTLLHDRTPSDQSTVVPGSLWVCVSAQLLSSCHLAVSLHFCVTSPTITSWC